MENDDERTQSSFDKNSWKTIIQEPRQVSCYYNCWQNLITHLLLKYHAYMNKYNRYSAIQQGFSPLCFLFECIGVFCDNFVFMEARPFISGAESMHVDLSFICLGIKSYPRAFHSFPLTDSNPLRRTPFSVWVFFEIAFAHLMPPSATCIACEFHGFGCRGFRFSLNLDTLSTDISALDLLRDYRFSLFGSLSSGYLHAWNVT